MRMLAHLVFAIVLASGLTATANEEVPRPGDEGPESMGPDSGIRYRTHISGPIAPVNRRITEQQKNASRDHDVEAQAGDLFSDWTFGLGSAWTWIEDDVIGWDAMAREYFVTANATVGDTRVGASIAYDRFTVDDINLDMKTIAMDFHAIHPVTDWLDLGVLSVISNSEIEDGPDGFTYGAGPLASAHFAATDALDLGLTTSINFYDVDGNYDVLLTALFDANYQFTDTLGLYGYGTYNDSQRDTDDDRSFWTVGGQITFAANDRINVSVGYETTLGFSQYDDDTVLISGDFSF